MKKVVSYLLALIMCLSAALTLPVTAEAAAWPSLSSSAYCEFKATKQINVYKNTGCTTRGTSSPAKSYNAYISKNDVCRIYGITSSYITVSYPTSSGNRTGYIKRSDLIKVSAPTAPFTSKGKTTTYAGAGGASYGSTAKGDQIYACGTSSGYTAIIYTAKSGSRAFKFGWVTTNAFNSLKGSKSSSSTPASSGAWQWPMNNHKVSQGFGNYYPPKAASGRPYHAGMDLVNSDRIILAAASGTVAFKGTSTYNGNHIVLKHNLNGTTVYTLYAHLENYNSCPDVGKSVSKGQAIGKMGSTGKGVTGAHLHFGIFSGSYSSDPVGYTDVNNTTKANYNGRTFYNPTYVIANGKLP